MDKNLTIIYITGATGSGKSKLVGAAAQNGGIALFDCLGKDTLVWKEPEPATCEVVVVDHVHSRGDSTIVEDAAGWCAKHGKPLWLAEIWRSHLDATGIGESGQVFELNLDVMSADNAGAALNLSRRSHLIAKGH